MSGYSKTRLIDKLGIKPGFKIYVENVPENYFEILGDLPANVTKIKKPSDLKSIDFVHFFTKEKKLVEKNFSVFKNYLSHTGLLWISWPKGSSKIKTDLNENIIREIGLREGLVDVKVCAVDEIWSGLKFVYRVKDR